MKITQDKINLAGIACIVVAIMVGALAVGLAARGLWLAALMLVGSIRLAAHAWACAAHRIAGGK